MGIRMKCHKVRLKALSLLLSLLVAQAGFSSWSSSVVHAENNYATSIVSETETGLHEKNTGLPEEQWNRFYKEVQSVYTDLQEETIIPVIVELHCQENCADKEDSRTLFIHQLELELNRKIKIPYVYDRVLYGFMLEIPFGELKVLQQHQEIKSLYLEPVFEAPKTVYPPRFFARMQSIGSLDGNLSSNGEGEGLLIAVIDSGVQADHEAMHLTDEQHVKLTETQSEQVIRKQGLPGQYGNAKIPYLWDYVDNDHDVLNPDSNHGMHVAGIIAGNSRYLQGVAPEAQLAVFKVFGRNNRSVGYTKALDDALKLGVDAVNMSLGSPAFGKNYWDVKFELLNRLLAEAEKQGVSISVSAGNHTYHGGGEYKLPSTQPDYGIVASPAVYDSIIAVASSDNQQAVLKNALQVKTSAGKITIYVNQLSGGNPNYALEFTAVSCGYGAESDFVGKTFTPQQYALVKRGGKNAQQQTLTFEEKAQNAAKAGAAGLLIYDPLNAEMLKAGVQLQQIPVIFIPQQLGEQFEQDPTLVGKIIEQAVVQLDTAGKPSSFSSWGVSPEFELKPEIMAPGGHVYSADNNNRYIDMSGTSMAAPQVAGAVALLRRKLLAAGVALSDVSRYTKNILMSTAHPVSFSADAYYSPRKQGAGEMDLTRALISKVFLADADTGLAKINLGNLSGTEITLPFKIENFGNEDQNYHLSIYLATDAVENGMFTMKPRFLQNVEAGEIQVAAGRSATKNLTFSLADKDSELTNLMPNGYYVDGYVFAKNTTDEKDVFVLPFVGFRGNWHTLPVVEKAVYEMKDGEKPLYDSLVPFPETFGTLDVSRNAFTHFYSEVEVKLPDSPFPKRKTVVLGETTPAEATTRTFAKAVAFSPNDDRQADRIRMSAVFLRNYKDLSLAIYADENCTELINQPPLSGTNYGLKNYGASLDPYSARGAFKRDELLSWNGKNRLYQPVQDGTYYVSLRATPYIPQATEQEFKYPIIVDRIAPEVNRADVQKEDRLVISVTDERSGIASVQARNKSTGQAVMLRKDSDTTYSVAQSDLLGSDGSDSKKNIELIVLDHAYNKTVITLDQLHSADEVGRLTYVIENQTGKTIETGVEVVDSAQQVVNDLEHLPFGRYTVYPVAIRYWGDDLAFTPPAQEIEITAENREVHLQFVMTQLTIYRLSDSALFNEAKRILHLADHEKITNQNVDALTHLGTSAEPVRGVRSISGVEKLPALKELHLFGAKMYGDYLLEKLTHLTALSLVNKEMETRNANALKNLSELNYLSLDQNKIEDLSALGALSLQTFSARDQKIERNTNTVELDLPLYDRSGQLVTIEPGDSLTVSGSKITLLNPKNKQVFVTRFASVDDTYTGTIQITYNGENVTPVETVHFADRAVQEAVTRALGLPEGEPIPKHRLNEITSLGDPDYPVRNVQVLTDLFKLPQLTGLTLENIPASLDLSVLGQVSGLRHLQILHTPNFSLQRLASLTGLKTLELLHDDLTDLQGLEKFTDLVRLDLSNNRIKDISVLANLTKLEQLYLKDNQIENIQALAHLLELQYVYLTNNKISDFSPLGEVIRRSGSSTINALSQVVEYHVPEATFTGPLKDENGKTLALQHERLSLQEDGKYVWKNPQKGERLTLSFRSDSFLFLGTITLVYAGDEVSPHPNPNEPDPTKPVPPTPVPNPTPSPNPKPGTDEDISKKGVLIHQASGIVVDISKSKLVDIATSLEVQPVSEFKVHENHTQAYDIYLLDEHGNRIEQSQQGNDLKAEVFIPVSGSLQAEKCAVYYIPEQGKPERLVSRAVTRNGVSGRSFIATHFSRYALVTIGVNKNKFAEKKQSTHTAWTTPLGDDSVVLGEKKQSMSSTTEIQIPKTGEGISVAYIHIVVVLVTMTVLYSICLYGRFIRKKDPEERKK